MKVNASAYLRLKPVFNRYGTCTGFTIAAVTQRPPARIASGGIVVELKMAMPSEAFEPLRPVVNIEVPEGVGEIIIDAEAGAP